MKKLFALLSAVFAYLYLVPFVFAQAPPLIGCPGAPFNVLCFNTDSVPGIISAAITFIFVIGVIIAFFFLISGGVIRWTFSGGDKATIESARGAIVASIVGLIILFLTFLIFNILLRFFGLGIGSITEIPKIP